MKNLLLISVLTMALLSSCSTLYVQTLSVKSADQGLASSEPYKYSDGNVVIHYDFWAENGDPGFVIENMTDQIIYVDLGKTFYVSGNTANDYFLNRTFSSSSSVEVAAAATGSASAYGVWYPSGFLGSLTKSLTKAAAKNSSKGVSYEEKEIIAIPAHCQKRVSEYSILSSPLQDCSVKMFPNSKGASFQFSNDQMPQFSNIITYKVGEKGENKTILNKFYITGFTNMKETEAIEKTKVGCKSTGTIKTYKLQNPNSFYIIYTSEHSNRYSEDAKKEMK